MSLHAVSLINQINQATSTNHETTHRLVQWIDHQDKYNHKNNRDIRALDTAIEDDVKEIKEELQRKGKDLEEGQEKQIKFDDLLGKVIAAIAVLEGQIEQHCTLINQAQTIATWAIKHVRLSTCHSDSNHCDNAEAGHSHVSSIPRSTLARTLGYPLA